ncbi:MAG: DUF6502 family protein [Chitinivorax sp.]
MLDQVNAQESPNVVLLQQADALLRPLVRLLIANGGTYPQLISVLKDVFIEEARLALQSSGRKDTDSALALLTGVHRKEIRNRASRTGEVLPDLTLASQVYTRWLTDAGYRDVHGKPLPLARSGDAPSFESLARAVSKDLHPRTLLDELLRLGLVRLEQDQVLLNGDAFVPQAGFAEKLSMLVANVSDHLAAGAHNLMQQNPPLLEQSVFADQLQPASVLQLQQLARQLWQQDFKTMVNEASRLCAVDETQGGQQRVRFGVYFYAEPMNHGAEQAHADAANNSKETS